MPQLCAFPSALLGLRFDGPVTVIAGEDSDYVVGHDGAAFEPMFTRVEFQVIADAGHWVHADQPRPSWPASGRRCCATATSVAQPN
jgi:pimeloyl-ACP methyl ester carboxylesterase